MRSRLLTRTAGLVAASTLALWPGHGLPATTSSSFTVQITITSACAIGSAGALTFPSQGVLTSNVDHTSTIQVQCTDTTPYNIGLNAGTGAGATVATRKLTNGSNTLDYTLYRDAGRTEVWGDTVATNTLSATGNGAAQGHTVYGRVFSQSTPAAGTYSDTITVTVTY
jgi:spore coat protein U-like protein